MPGKRLIAFAGAAESTFLRARSHGYASLELESPTAHVVHAHRMYELANSQYPIEASWLSPALVRRTLREYALADVIWVNSDYSSRTFLEQGVPECKLRRRHLRANARYLAPNPSRPPDGTTRFIYVGSLSTTKGVPLLVEAFSGIGDEEISLKLVGGFGTRGMRRLIHATLRRDPRVQLAVGDPLPHLQAADVFVFPSYSDGLGLAALEAMACGLQIIITREAGASDFVTQENGRVVVPGSVSALREAMQAIHTRRKRRSELDEGRVFHS